MFPSKDAPRNTHRGLGESQESASFKNLSAYICLLARITQLVRGFSSTWKQSVEALSQDVMRSFTNFKNGTSIIQVQPYETNLVNICVAI